MIPGAGDILQVAGSTDIGLVRKVNEDSIFFNDDIFIVADGMGGHMAGEVASQDAISCIKDFLEQNFEKEPLFTIGGSIKHANKYIFSKAKSDCKYKGMGTTVTLAKIVRNQLFYAHIGDSRLYIFRDDYLDKITSDHSLVAQLVEIGQLTDEQAAQHPNKNIITKAVGTFEDIEPDTGQCELKEGDIILLCSDGLTNMINTDKIKQIILENFNNVQNIVNHLVDEAKKAGGNDNISVICIKYCFGTA